MHLRLDPDMALSRLDVYTAAHCIIRPILLFRKWEEVSRAIFGVNIGWECVEFPPHHFGAAQAHALATRPGHGAESPRRVYYCCTLHHTSNIIVSRVGGSLEGNIRRTHVVGVCINTLVDRRRHVHLPILSEVVPRSRTYFGGLGPRIRSVCASTANMRHRPQRSFGWLSLQSSPHTHV